MTKRVRGSLGAAAVGRVVPVEQARILALLIERIDIGAEGLDIMLRVDGISGLRARDAAGGNTARAIDPRSP